MADPKKPGIELDMSPADTAAEMERMRRRIAEQDAKIEALNSRATSGLSITSATEISAGEDEDGKEMWWYRIDLPPSGGIEVKLNGIAFYHGEQYKVGTDMLRTLKDIVFRCWKHESEIQGSNENFYRQPKNSILRGQGR